MQQEKISCIPIKRIWDNKVYEEFYDSDEEFDEFYEGVRKGNLSSTSQINPEEFIEYFKSILAKEKDGDIIHVSLSSSLSGTFNGAVLAANELKIPFIDRAELLGLIMGAYERSIGVSGTHGKTTTTSLISEILLLAGYDPTLNVGGIFKGIGSNFRIGGSGYFVAEACEYFDSFSKFYPFIGVILNIEHDHTDYFKNTNQLRGSFHRFAENVSESGLLVVNSDIHDLDEFIEGLSCKVITYGEKGDYTAVNIKFSTEGTSSFDI